MRTRIAVLCSRSGPSHRPSIVAQAHRVPVNICALVHSNRVCMGLGTDIYIHIPTGPQHDHASRNARVRVPLVLDDNASQVNSAAQYTTHPRPQQSSSVGHSGTSALNARQPEIDTGTFVGGPGYEADSRTVAAGHFPQFSQGGYVTARNSRSKSSSLYPGLVHGTTAGHGLSSFTRSMWVSISKD